MPVELNGLSDPVLAYNLNGVADYSTQMAFLNLMKMSRPFEADDWDTDTHYSHADLVAMGIFDENGYPTRLPDGIDTIGTIWDWTAGEEFHGVSESRAGTYVVTWEGEGTLEIGGLVNILSQEEGRIVFENPTGSMFNLNIRATDPNGTGDYIRDIAIVNEDYVDLYEAGALFNPDWLELVDDSRQFRFMDWMDTNNSPIREWSEVNSTDAVTYVGHGMVPVEVMVQLANEAGVDPWFTLPLHASDELIRNFAEYVEEHLDPNLVATFELSNETWNWMFQQTHDLGAMSEAEWGLDEAGFQDPQSMYAKQAVEMALILDDVFEGQGARLHKTLGVLTGDTWLAEKILTAPMWRDNDPDGYVSPASVFDSLAVTTYFGGSVMFDETLRQEFGEILADPDIDAAAWLTAQLRNPDYESSIPRVLASLEELNDLADLNGMGIRTYEGGQHVHHLFGLAEEARDFMDFFVDYVRSEDMAELYQELWDGWARVGDGPQMQFTEVGAPGAYGSWSLRASLTDTNPRLERLEQLNQTTQAWWEDRGGAHFQQGVTQIGTSADEVFEGSQAEDYLIGGEGDDVLTGHGGSDGLHGGLGEDRAVFTGRQEDYSFEFVIEGFVATLIVTDGRVDGDGVDRLVEIEQLEFADGVLSVADLAAQMGITLPDPRPAPPPPADPGDPGAPGDPGSPTSPAPSEPSAGDDVIDGTAGNDILRGLAGNDWLGGNAGDDRISGDAGNDILEGGSGFDRLNGGIGNDLLIGGVGVDLLRGSEGDDMIVGGSWDQMDRALDIAIFSGDLADYDFQFGQMRVDETGQLLFTLTVTDRADGGSDGVNEGRDTLFGVDELRFADQTLYLGDLAAREGVILPNLATRLDDDMTGEAGDDWLHGLGGNDLIRGRAGADELHGGQGADDLRGGNGHDRLVGGAGGDRLDGGAGQDRLDGDGGTDTLIGRDGADDLYGGAGQDRLLGGEGDDRLRGGEGQDQLIGGTGRDVFVMEAGGGRDRVRDFEDGVDLIDLTALDLQIGSETAADAFAKLTLVQLRAGVLVALSDDRADAVLLENMTLSQLSEDDFLFTDDPGLAEKAPVMEDPALALRDLSVHPGVEPSGVISLSRPEQVDLMAHAHARLIEDTDPELVRATEADTIDLW